MELSFVTPSYPLAGIGFGVRPTVSDSQVVSVESYILDYSGNLYGKRIRLEFLEFLRAEQRFADTDALKEQIARDTQSVREFAARF